MSAEIFENERAIGYNQFVRTWIPNYDYFLDNLPLWLSDTVDKNLLVVGCGTGNEIERFINTSKKWKVTGIDPSPKMLAQAQSKFGKNPNVTLIEGLLSDLPTTKKYGAATVILILHFLKDNGSKLELLKDIALRLSEGASLIILDITGTKNHILNNLEVLKKLVQGKVEDAEIEARIDRIATKLHYVSEDRLASLCVEAGFEKPLRFFQNNIYMGWMAVRSTTP